MKNGRLRLLMVSSHVVQYSAAVFREMTRDPAVDLEVVYCSMQGAEPGMDPEFGVEVAWDVPLLDGYSWRHLPNRAPRPGLGRFWGQFNPDIWRLIREDEFDAVLVGGYYNASGWIAILAAKWHGVPVLFTTDLHTNRSLRPRPAWWLQLKRQAVARILRLSDGILANSSGTVAHLERLGVTKERIIPACFVADNRWWTESAEKVNRAAVRESWGISAAARVVLFCAKLQPWKRPQDLLEAFARAGVPDAYLVFAGDGPLRERLETCAHALGIADRVRWLGVVNQSALPGVYRASDAMVLPSEYERFGVVVNEAMLCGCPVVVSDRVGARYDLVRDAETGYVYPCGDVDALAKILRQMLASDEELRRMSEAARRRLETWSPREFAAAWVEATQRARRRKSAKNGDL